MSDKLQGGIKAGSTDVSLPVELRSSTNSTELTGKAFGDITGSYWRQGGSRVAITMATQTVAGAHSDGGFVEVDATNMPGVYRLDLPDAAVATGADWVVVSLKCTGAFTQTFYLPLTTNVIQSADAPASGAIADAVWDEAISGHLTAGTTGAALSAANAPTASTIADAVWDEALSGHQTAGTAGAALSALGALGAGAYSITVTVTDGTDPLENAAVRLIEGANVFTATTNASGNATFALDAATYAAAVTKAGYSFTPATRTVTGAQAGTLVNDLEMTLTAVPAAPADASLSTVYGYTENINNVVRSGIVVRFSVTTKPLKSEKILEVASQTATTDSNGFFSIALQQDIAYRVDCPELGLKHIFTPTGDTFDILTLI